MELRQYLDIVRRHKWLVLQAVVVVGLLAGVFATMQTPKYQATARLLLRPTDPGANLFASGQSATADPDRYLAAQIEVVHSAGVAQAAAGLLGGAPIAGEGIAVRGGSSSDIMTITATSLDPVRASELANAYAKAYITNRRDVDVAGLQRVADELETKLADLKVKIGDLDAQIRAQGEIESIPVAPTPAPAGAAPTPAPAAVAPTPAPPGPTPSSAVDEALKAERYAAAVQYEELYSRQQELLIQMGLKRGDAELISAAGIPSEASGGNPLKQAGAGAFVGLAIGIGLAFLRDQLDDRVRNQDDAERASELPILAELPRDAASVKDPRRVAAVAEPQGALAESAKALRTTLHFLGVDQPVRRLVVTSPSPGDGKSFVAMNLATVYAQAGYWTILVSSDLRRPRIDEALEVSEAYLGLTDVLAPTDDAGERHNAPAWPVPYVARPTADGALLTKLEQEHRNELRELLGSAVAPTEVPNLFLLRAGSEAPNPAELLASRRMSEIMEELSDLADVVIFDTPPVLAVTDPAVLGARADGVILVVANDQTRQGHLRRAAAQLRNSHARLLGVVVNKGHGNGGDGYYSAEYYSKSTTPKRTGFLRGRKADRQEA